MTVTFFQLNTTTAETESVGTLTLIDGQLVAEPPDAIALMNILAEPLEIYHTDRPRTKIDHTKHPEAFLKALPTVYRGTYFWAKPVED
jgi:hypothetical protein